MKNKIAIAIAVFSLNMMVAQTNPSKENDVPGVVTEKFKTDYPDITAEWTLDADNYYVAEFKNATTKIPTLIVYDKMGNRIRTETEMSPKSYPVVIDDYYTNKHPGNDYKVWSSKDSKGQTTYYVKHKGDVHWFDKDGKYTTTKPERNTQKVKPLQ